MEGFNQVLNKIMSGDHSAVKQPDTNTEVGNFGHADATDINEKPAEDKLVLYLDSGVELHIPVSIFEQMTNAMNGEGESAVATTMITTTAPEGEGGVEDADEGGLGTELDSIGSTESDSDESDSDESEESEESDNSETEDEDEDNKKDNPFAEGCGKGLGSQKHKKQNQKQKLKHKQKGNK